MKTLYRIVSSPREVMRCAWGRLKPAPNPFESVPELREFADAIEHLKYPKDKFSETYFLRLHNRADWTGTDTVLVDFCRRLFLELRRREFPMYVHTAWRSPELQLRLFNEGKSTLARGPHQNGAALDIVHAHYHWQMPWAGWKYVGMLGEHIARQNNWPIEWGGRWTSFPDPAHWQLKGWRNRLVIPEHDEVLRRSPYSKNMVIPNV